MLKTGRRGEASELWRMSNLTISKFTVFKISGFLIYRFRNFLFPNFPFQNFPISQFILFKNYCFPMYRFPVYRFTTFRYSDKSSSGHAVVDCSHRQLYAYSSANLRSIRVRADPCLASTSPSLIQSLFRAPRDARSFRVTIRIAVRTHVHPA